MVVYLYLALTIARVECKSKCFSASSRKQSVPDFWMYCPLKSKVSCPKQRATNGRKTQKETDMWVVAIVAEVSKISLN